MPLTIIVPARHEEKIVTRTLDDLEANVKTQHRTIVVNDSDPGDLTADVVRRYIKSHSNIQLIQRSTYPCPTFATALILGFNEAEHGAILPVMADRCDDTVSIDLMYQTLLQGWDVVSGSRYMPGGRKIGGPAIQSFFSKFVCTTLRYFTGIPTHDVSNAFKMYRKSIVDAVSINPASGPEISMEITLSAYFSGARITEIPTTWTDRTANESKFRLNQHAPQYLRIYLWALYQSLFRRKS